MKSTFDFNDYDLEKLFTSEEFMLDISSFQDVKAGTMRMLEDNISLAFIANPGCGTSTALRYLKKQAKNDIAYFEIDRDVGFRDFTVQLMNSFGFNYPGYNYDVCKIKDLVRAASHWLNSKSNKKTALIIDKVDHWAAYDFGYLELLFQMVRSMSFAIVISPTTFNSLEKKAFRGSSGIVSLLSSFDDHITVGLPTPLDKQSICFESGVLNISVIEELCKSTNLTLLNRRIRQIERMARRELAKNEG